MPSTCPADLCGTQLRIFDLVAASKTERVSTDTLIDCVWRNDPNGGPEWAASVIRRSVFELNKKLVPFGLKIVGKQGRSSPGYRLERVSISRLPDHFGLMSWV